MILPFLFLRFSFQKERKYYFYFLSFHHFFKDENDFKREKYASEVDIQIGVDGILNNDNFGGVRRENGGQFGGFLITALQKLYSIFKVFLT